MITGIAEQKFNKWYCNHTDDKNLSEHAVTSFFYKMHFLLQYGMFDAFFNKNGIFPTVLDTYLEDPEPKNRNSKERFHTVVRTHEKWMACGFHPTKIEAQKEAIEVSNEKFNSKYL